MSQDSQPLLFPEDDPGPEFITLASVGDLDEGQGKAFAVGNRMIALFLHHGQYYAIDDFCPHQGASLAEGYLSDCTVSCPWHHWRFSLKDGAWVDNPKLGVQRFEVRVVNNKIGVMLPAES
jgi:nitrite reductase (NADH) small subunit